MKPVVFLCFFFFLFYSTEQLQCLNEQGRPVDWWYISKLPYIKGNPISKDGFGYAYADPTTQLKITNNRLDSNINNALAYTLRQVYSLPAGNGVLFWNDQSPDDKSPSGKAHSKGVLSFNVNEGFFLRHSVPRFPFFLKDGYQGFPEYAKLYGQSFLCISMTSSSINTIINQMLVNEPYIYEKSISTDHTMRYPNLTRLANGEKDKIESKIDYLVSKGGVKFLDFAKSRYCECDLFDSIISRYLKSDMRTLTWGRPYMPSVCKPSVAYDVLNIMEIEWNQNLTYDSTKEHSKVGYTYNSITFCVGDINRMESQRKRGGGATCINNPSLAASFKRITKRVEEC